MEGEPASDKDKLLLTWAPHLVLDGAQYLAALCRVDRIVVCVPMDRDVVATAVTRAMAERTLHRHALVKEELARPPGRFIAGEESALANWLESGRSLPVFRPDKGHGTSYWETPRPGAQRRDLGPCRPHCSLWRRTLPAAWIAREPGTSLVTISGNVAQPGVVEVDLGTPLSDIALLAQPVKPVQALLVGGYGGCGWVRSTLELPTPPSHCERSEPLPASGDGGARRIELWPHRVGPDRPLPGQPECTSVWPLSLRPTCHCRRFGRTGPTSRGR